MTAKKININFKGSEDDREHLRILAAKARLSQSEFLRKLIYGYGEELVRSQRNTDQPKYYVEWRFPISYSNEKPQLPKQSEFNDIDEISRLCVEYGVSARLEDENGVALGLVHSDGSCQQPTANPKRV